jgi:hypothetical protein
LEKRGETMRVPGDNEPDPPGGRAADRLREFLHQHMDEDEAKKQEIEHGIDSGSEGPKSGTPSDKTGQVT